MRLDEALGSLPTEWANDPLPHIDAALKASGRKIVILDDDVMGTQSVHDIAVLMDWSVDALRTELEADSRAFFVVTNARTMPESQARAVNSFITRNLCEAARQAGVDFSVVSRLDSTLRGHFPAEMQAIESSLSAQIGRMDNRAPVPRGRAVHIRRYAVCPGRRLSRARRRHGVLP